MSAPLAAPLPPRGAPGAGARLLAALLTFLACWALLLAWAARSADARAARDLVRPPQSVRDLSYPVWLWRRAPAVRPSATRLMYVGDSIVFGTSSSSVLGTAPHALVEALAPRGVQTFTFCMPNLEIEDAAPLLRENLRAGEFALVQIIPMAHNLRVPAQLAREEREPPSGPSAPFYLARGEVAMLCGKTPALMLFDATKRLKRALVRHAPEEDLCVPFSRRPQADQRRVLEYYAPLFNEEIAPPLLDRIAAIAAAAGKDPTRVLLYAAPINPAVSGDPRLGPGSGFVRNLDRLAKAAARGGASFLDANAAGGWAADDFHDACHMTDSGCGKLGRLLAARWLELRAASRPALSKEALAR
jgi:hypothetical protein